MMGGIIDSSHGSGGSATQRLIEEIFKETFENEYLEGLKDSAVVPGNKRLAVTTDSFVVRPVFYKGGDIGKLAVCGTVNDILMSGAKPEYLTAGYILEEGMDIEGLRKIVTSMAQTAEEAGVYIVAGDTKVIEASSPDNPGVIINTAGVGFLDDDVDIGPEKIKAGDAVILSGNLGDHHAAILSKRMGIENNIASDNAPLCDIVSSLMKNGIKIHAMRDVTRGGLATVLNEFASASSLHISIKENNLPVAKDVAEFARLLGLDPLYMGNEGKCVIITPADEADRATELIRSCRYGENASIIGEVKDDKAGLTVITPIGGVRVVGPLIGEGLPRIC